MVLATLFFVSCNDDYQERNNFSSKSRKVTRVNLKKLQSNRNAYKKVNSILNVGKNKNQQNRIVYNDLYDFYIDTNEIIYIENGNYNSFTLAVFRTEETTYKENLFLHLQPSGEYAAYILRYDLNEQDLINYQNGLPIQNLNQKTVIIPLDNFEVGSLASRTSCVPEFMAMCEYEVVVEHSPIPVNNGDLPDWNGTEVTYSYQLIGCTYTYLGCTGGGGGSSDGGDGGDPFYVGGSGSGNNSSDGSYFDPEIGIIIQDRNIQDLKRLTQTTFNIDGNHNSSNIKLKIDYLKSRLNTHFEEDGAMFDSSQNVLLPSFTSCCATNWYSAEPSYYISLHMHQNKFYNRNLELKPTNPVQSDTDVYNFLKLFKYTNNRNATAFFVSRLGTFALRVTDQVKASNAEEELFHYVENGEVVYNNKEEWKKFYEKYDDLVMKPYIDAPEDLNSILNGFIKFINSHIVNGNNIGIGIYQAVYDENENIIDWIKL